MTELCKENLPGHCLRAQNFYDWQLTFKYKPNT